MAFDGGAPRAKMDQQRQRRFQSSKHFSKVEVKLDSLGVEACNASFKGNQITTGLKFMY
jgi:5'-3' exoribonuclease 1